MTFGRPTCVNTVSFVCTKFIIKFMKYFETKFIWQYFFLIKKW